MNGNPPRSTRHGDVAISASAFLAAPTETAARVACLDFADQHDLTIVAADVPDYARDRPVRRWLVEMERLDRLRDGEPVDDGLLRIARPLLAPFGPVDDLGIMRPGVVDLHRQTIPDDDHTRPLPAGSQVEIWVYLADQPDPWTQFASLDDEDDDEDDEDDEPPYPPLLDGVRYDPADWISGPTLLSLLAGGECAADVMTHHFPRLVTLAADTVGWDTATAEARLLAFTEGFPFPAQLGAPPDPTGTGTGTGGTTVWAVLGAFPEPVLDIYDAVVPFFPDRRWHPVENDPDRIRLEWHPDAPPPTHGFVRLQLDIGATIRHTGDRPIRVPPTGG